MSSKDEHLTVQLSERSARRLDHLMQLSGAESREECLRNAMRLLDQIIQWSEDANTFALVTPRGDLVPVSIFVDPAETEKPRFRVIEGGQDA